MYADQKFRPLPLEAITLLNEGQLIHAIKVVRQTEGLVAKLQNRAGKPAKTGPVVPLPTDAHVANLENRLRERLGTKVQLRYAHGKGALEISFFSDPELERILQILGVAAE